MVHNESVFCCNGIDIKRLHDVLPGRILNINI